MADIVLSAAMRSNLLTLQSVQKNMDTTQGRLATGLKVNSPLDNPTNYFAASNMKLRASELNGLKDAMGTAVSTIKATQNAMDGIMTLVKAAKGVLEAARTAATAEDRAVQTTAWNEIMTQIDELAKDADFAGINFLSSSGSAVSMTVQFDARTGRSSVSKLTIDGFGGLHTMLDLTGNNALASDADFSAQSGADLTSLLSSKSEAITNAINYLQSKSQTMSTNLAIVSARLDFTSDFSNTLKEAADKLTLADTNEEGANMLALQTRQQLGVTSLSMASQSAQSVLRLF